MRIDTRQHHGSAVAEGGKRGRNGRCGRKQGGPPSSQGLEATMAVRLLAPWSLPTRLLARMPQELAYLVHGVLPYAAILQSTPPDEHYSPCEIPALNTEATITRLFTCYIA